jgi:hypothetical protein
MTDETTATALRHRLNEVRESMTDVHLTLPDSAVFGAAARRRTRRGLAAVTAACAVIGLALGVLLPGAPARNVHVNLAAWSVDTSGHGTVAVTVRELTHAAQLQQALTRAGVPAIVVFDRGCLTPQNQNAFRQTAPRFLTLTVQPPGYIVTPSHIPAGDKILISIVSVTGRSGSGQPIKVTGFGWGLVQAGQPLHCASR